MSFLGSVFGEKPNVADYIPTVFSEEQMKSIMENLRAFPEISRLGSAYYDYMMGSMTKAIPEFANILKAGGETTAKMLSTAGEELSGIVPQDVQDQLRRSTAFTNLMAGTAGSQMGAANQARNLGLTSLDMISKGAALQGEAGNAAQRWAGLASGLIMSPSGFMVTPEQQMKLTMQNNLYKQATQQLRENVAAAPDPALQALNQWVQQVGGSIIGAYATGGMGGKGDYKTSYNANSYLGGAGGQSDVITNPGHYVTDTGGGGDLSAASSFRGTGATGFDFGIGYPSSDPNLYNPTSPYLYGAMGGDVTAPNQIPGAGYNFSGFSTPWSPNLYGTTDFNVTQAGV
jgi:hypothetical protein